MKKIILAAIALMMACGHADARKVSGIVTSGEEKLGGVIVTDGKNFTQTKKNGKFSFEIEDDAEFVYIVTPTGYVADFSSGVPAFYQRAAGMNKFMFDLAKSDNSGDYTLVAVSDPQIKHQEQFERFSGVPMADLCGTTKSLKGAAAGLALGDIVDDALVFFGGYKKEIIRTGIPFYPVIGNHDHDQNVQGDHAAAAAYRNAFGPENYAFFLGHDLVIVLDNIIYETERRYREGYTDETVAWVKALLRLVPTDVPIFVAQHSPLIQHGRKILNYSDMVNALYGRNTIFISGHSHAYNNRNIADGIIEHNISSICGALWLTEYCWDGAPDGYKVYTRKNGNLEWYFKTLGESKDYQVEVYGPGQSLMHPNSVVLNVWDWDPQWKVEWFEDGRPMGKLKPVSEAPVSYIREVESKLAAMGITRKYGYSISDHYFAATPTQYAKTVTVSVENRFGQVWVYDVDMTDYVDVQAHVGDSEDVMEAVKDALDMGVNTLEFGIHADAEGNVTLPNGLSAGEFIDFVEAYTKENGYSPVRYSVEIKSRKGKGEGKEWPTYDRFSTTCCKFLNSKYLDDRLTVQCADYRALNYINEKYPELVLSYMMDKDVTDFDAYMKKLKFTPYWLSPHHSLVDEALIKKCREKGIKLAPRGVNGKEDVERMLELGVEAVISDSPDTVLMQTRGFLPAE